MTIINNKHTPDSYTEFPEPHDIEYLIDRVSGKNDNVVSWHRIPSQSKDFINVSANRVPFHVIRQVKEDGKHSYELKPGYLNVNHNTGVQATLGTEQSADDEWLKRANSVLPDNAYAKGNKELADALEWISDQSEQYKSQAGNVKRFNQSNAHTEAQPGFFQRKVGYVPPNDSGVTR